MKKIITICALFFSTLISAASINKIVVFGDSLSDNGNLYEYMKRQLPLSPPYYKGRFTNGPVWIELVAEHFYPSNTNDHLLDYAFGGAGVMEDDDIEDDLFTLHREMDTYLLAHENKANENSLYVVWIGSNNYLAIPEDPDSMLKVVLTGMEHGLQHLIDKGAKHIMVINVPDLGRIPAAKEFEAVDELSYLSKQHNIEFGKQIDVFKQRYPDIQWIYLDIYKELNEMMLHPEQNGFTNVTDTCYELVDMLAPANKYHSILRMVASIKPHEGGDVCEGYLFFDPVHPSAQAHREIASKTIKLFEEAGLTFN